MDKSNCSSDDNVPIDDDFEFLVQCPLKDISHLEEMNLSCLSKWIYDTDDDESNVSVNMNDLEEWFENEFDCEENDCMYQKDIENPNEDISNIQATNCFKMNVGKIDTGHHINIIEKNLKMSMIRTQMSRRFLQNRLNSIVSKKKDDSSSKYLGKDESDGSSKQKSTFQKTILKYEGFFNGKRSDLTTEVEASRNHLKTLGISFQHKDLEFRQKNVVVHNGSRIICRNQNAMMA